MFHLKLLKNLSWHRKLILVVILILMHLPGLYLISNYNKFKTLFSLKQISGGEIYVLNYSGDYKLKKFLNKGFNTYQELYKFLDRNLVNYPDISDELSLYSCSAFSASITSGDLITGRNLDIPGVHPVLVLYTNPPEAYASVSTVDISVLGYSSSQKELESKLSSLKGRKKLLAAPYMPRDGMNEYGLVVATLNSPKQQINKISERISIGRWQVVRLLLDYARNTTEAVALLNKYNCFDGEVHYFITDSSGKSIIAEYINNQLVITEKKSSFQTVSNFLIAHPEHIGTGQDRYNKMNAILNDFNGKIPEEDSLRILKLVSQPTTAWSVVYNQTGGNIDLVVKNKFYSVNKFNFKLHN